MYEPTVWVNDKSPDIDEDNLNKIEQGIKDAHDMAEHNAENLAAMAGNQMPVEYLKAAVDEYVNNNSAGFATQVGMEELESQLSGQIEANASQLSSEIVEVKEALIDLLPTEELVFEVGGIDVNTGVSYEGTYGIIRARSQFVWLKKNTLIKSINTNLVLYVFYYGIDKVFVSSTQGTSDSFTTTEEGYYRIVVRPINDLASVTDMTDYLPLCDENIFAKKIKLTYIVAQDGTGDFTDIQSALDFAPDSLNFPITIIVKTGTYTRFSTCSRKQHIDDILTNHTDFTERYLSIIGVDKKHCIVKSDNGQYFTPAAEVKINGLVSNMTFISSHDNPPEVPEDAGHKAYAIHDDYRVANVTYDNCIMISYQAPAIGIGGAKDKKVKIKNCELYSYATSDYGTLVNYGGLFYHSQPTENITGQELWIENTFIYSENGNKALWIDKGTVSELECDVTLINNTIYGKNCGAVADVDLDLLTPWCHGNNISELNKA